MDVVNQAKNIGAVLGTASVVAYVYGYLTLRARAYVLGTEPAFKLVDEIYVFAGFRVLLIAALVVLLASPVVLLLRWLAMSLPVSGSSTPFQILQWLLLVVVAFMTVVAFTRIFAVSGVLLQQGALPAGGLADAVLGGSAGLRLGLMFAIVLTLALTGLWLISRLGAAAGPFEWVLTLVVGLQVVLLPIYHGALYADRRVRVLDGRPESVQGVSGPLAIVDRTADQATLLGVDAAGGRRLVSVELGDLNGIPVRQVVTLEQFVRNHLGADVAALDDGPRSAPERAHTEGERAMAASGGKAERGFFSALVDYLKITFDGIGSLGDSVVDSGQVWAVRLDASGRPSEPRRVGTVDRVAWPVAVPDGATYYALQGGQLVRFDDGDGSLEVLDAQTRWRKLLGVTGDGTVFGLVFQEGQTRPATWRPDGGPQVDRSLLSEDHKEAVARLLQETRSYAGGLTLDAERSERGGRGFDVYLKSNGETFNLSDCGDDACGQASLSPDFRQALFVRQPRF